MASPHKAWRTMIEDSLMKAGIIDIEHSITPSSHMRFRGNVVVGGRKVPITLVTSHTPSDNYAAIHRVRADIRRMVRAARSITA